MHPECFKIILQTSQIISLLFRDFQDPVLFSGTLRHNLDPFEQYTEGRILEAATSNLLVCLAF